MLPGGRELPVRSDSLAAPLEMLHPECGVAEAYWTNFDLTDEAFFELIDAARPCFLALVESGEVRSSTCRSCTRSPSATRVATGTSVFDDPEYDERVATCSYG